VISEAVPKSVFWHRDLPPLDAEAVGEHTIEATSAHVRGMVGHRDELWDHCYQDLMAHTDWRLEQEIARMGGHYAHVLREKIEPKHDEVKDEGWLYGRFTYELYRKAP
jgi:hypothetical protein